MAVSVSCQGWSEELFLQCFSTFGLLKQQLERQHHAALPAGHPFQQHIATSMVSLCAIVIDLYTFFFYRDSVNSIHFLPTWGGGGGGG